MGKYEQRWFTENFRTLEELLRYRRKIHSREVRDFSGRPIFINKTKITKEIDRRRKEI